MVFLLMKGKSYYLAPAYPVLFAGGSVAIEMFFLKKRLNWLKFTIPSLILVSTIATSPIWLPILSIDKMLKSGIIDLRYDYREMIGWNELVESISKTYNTLSEEEKNNTEIITANYGEAGAINHYNKTYGLPGASSGISSYYYWGPVNQKATIVIFVGYSIDYLNQYFSDVRVVESITNSYEIVNEEYGQLITICRKPIKPLSEIWVELRH